MSRRRRSKNRRSSGNQQSANRNQQRNRSGGGGRGGNRSSGRPSDRERTRQRTDDGPGFWGDPSKLPTVETGITMTDDPHAVPRSLGEPPLPQKREIAEHYFAAIYERAVQTAGALAAAGGLIDFEQLNGSGDDEA